MELIKITEPATIRNYFLKVRELQKSGKEFPVNLDDVYPLVYSRRDKAMNELRKNFIENEDYNLHQMGKALKSNELRSGIRIDAFLTVPAMEFFIAKKVKEVFNVYREVFHKTMDEKQKPLSQLEIIAQSAQVLLQQEQRISTVEEKIHILENKNKTNPDYFTVVGYATLNNIDCPLPIASRIGREASKFCKDNNILTSEIPDPRFGKVKTYPYSILENIFNNTYINWK